MIDMRKNSDNRMLGIAVALVALFVVCGPAVAEEGQESWQPPPPMPEKFDWVQTTSLEWLKGKIVAMYDDSLDFDSKEFDLQTIDWSDIKEVRSVGTMQVAFEDGTIVIGQVLIDQETVRVLGDEEKRFPRSEVLSITAGATALHSTPCRAPSSA